GGLSVRTERTGFPLTMNHTVLLALLSRCRLAVLREMERSQQEGGRPNVSATDAPAAVTGTIRGSYDNAYFYILFVMFFYGFLALTLFRSFVHRDKTRKDPYEEFMGSDPSSPKCNAVELLKSSVNETTS
uniref:Uncharacterized protein n=1 Tax=Denticeps clupeoides TaxID=299321 RepID=A0AAY4AIW3_9TELE